MTLNSLMILLLRPVEDLISATVKGRDFSRFAVLR